MLLPSQVGIRLLPGSRETRNDVGPGICFLALEFLGEDVEGKALIVYASGFVSASVPSMQMSKGTGITQMSTENNNNKIRNKNEMSKRCSQ